MIREPRILMVDDEEDFCSTTADLLHSRGFNVRIVTSGEKALDVLKVENYDLIIIDFTMPGMDGIELICQIHQRNPCQRIMVASGFPTNYAQIQTFKAGVLFYISKPFSIDLLVQVICDALAENTYICGPVKLSFDELIQLYAFSKKTMVLTVKKGDEEGEIHFREGEIIHAQIGDCQGNDAFYKIQALREGVFSTRSFDRDIPRTIHTNLDALILEGERLHAESMKKIGYRKRGN